MLDSSQAKSYVDAFWEARILPTLMEYIRIPNKSPNFDPNWEAHGYMNQALELSRLWIEQIPLPNTSLHIDRTPNRTPLLLLEIDGTGPGNVLMYGHLDKQPEMKGWRKGLGPWDPIIEGDKLYGRGSADDGYALFSAFSAVLAVKQQALAHPRITILIEFSEESGSFDLPYYMEKYQEQIAEPDLVICLDSGVGNYEQFWSTTSLRGMLGLEVTANILQQGVHSGYASGIVPSSFRIIRELIERIEDVQTGEIKLDALHASIPDSHIKQAHAAAAALGDNIFTDYPWYSEPTPISTDLAELLLNRAWKPSLSVVAQDGIPSWNSGGNVQRPFTGLKLSLRLPPSINAQDAKTKLEQTLRQSPLYGSNVDLNFKEVASGWVAPERPSSLERYIQDASTAYFGKPAMSSGEGFSIPFMGMLSQQYPDAQFIVTGVLGPHSNAHGPNEFLHIPYAKKLTCCIAHILSQYQGN